MGEVFLAALFSDPSERTPTGRLQTEKPFLRALAKDQPDVPPAWMMRQAGRYLPEYRQLRAEAGSFLDLCYSPEMASEVTLQPIRRFAFDAAILFSDILVVPHALGQEVWFEEGLGPRLTPLRAPEDLKTLSVEGFHQHLTPVYETVSRVAEALPKETALIGFAGAPWTVASYMIEGGTSRDHATARGLAYSNPAFFEEIIARLVEATTAYLIRQVEAGAEALQIFDSWAGVWPEPLLRRYCLAPAQKIIAGVKAHYPDLPIILFPRGVGAAYRFFAEESGADGLSLDTTVLPGWAAAELQDRVTLQGNLDPLALVAGGEQLDREVERILTALRGGPFIFNLGHGIVPQTSPEHVGRVLELLRR